MLIGEKYLIATERISNNRSPKMIVFTTSRGVTFSYFEDECEICTKLG